MEKLKRPEIIFAIFALVFGTIIMFITPKYEVPDEMAHFNRAKEVSNGILYNNLPQNRHDNYKFHGASGYSPVMYISSAIGYKIGTYTKNNEIAFYLGRFFNLITWTILIFFAIKITPIFKWQFLFIALLPMSIFEGASYSADSFNNAFAFLFFSYIFKMIFEKQDIKSIKDYSLISIYTIIGAMCKCAISPIFLLLFSKINKYKKIIISFIIIIAISLLYIWTTNNYSSICAGVNKSNNKDFIRYDTIEFIKLISITCVHYFRRWIEECIGALGLLTIRFNNIFYNSTILLFFSSLFFIPEKYTIKLSQRIYSLLIFIGYVFFTCALLFINWTPQGSYYIQGIQGRYFLCVLPLLFITFKINNKNNNNSTIMKKGLIIYTLLMLLYCVDTLKSIYSLMFFENYPPTFFH